MIFDELWFWMLIISIVTIGFGIYMYEISYKSREGVPIWVYLLLVLGAILLIISFILAVVKYHASKTEAFIEGHLEGQAEAIINTKQNYQIIPERQVIPQMQQQQGFGIPQAIPQMQQVIPQAIPQMQQVIPPASSQIIHPIPKQVIRPSIFSNKPVVNELVIQGNNPIPALQQPTSNSKYNFPTIRPAIPDLE